MKTKSILLFALPLLTLCACNKEVQEVNDNQSVSIIASYDNADTKAILTEPSAGVYSMSWSGNEIMLVYPVYSSFPDVYGSMLPAPAKYIFTNQSGAGVSSRFTSDSFKEGGFQSGERYIVVVPKGGVSGTSAYTYRKGDQPATDIQKYGCSVIIPANQTYCASNPLCLDEDIIPLVGFIEVGNASFEPTNVMLKTPATVVKLVLTNKTGSTQNIGSITLEASNVKDSFNLANQVWFTINNFTTFAPIFDGQTYYRTGKSITLDCGGVAMANNETKTFSFVINGNRDWGTLTWKVFDTAATPVQIGSNITTTPAKKLSSGLVYTKTANL